MARQFSEASKVRRWKWTLPVGLLALLCGSGCSWGVFSELEDDAPVLRIDQSGDISSGSFGDDLVGLQRVQTDSGGALFAVGNANAALTTILFTAAGKPTVAQSDREVIKDKLGSPDRIHDIAPAPQGIPVDDAPGPFAYVASTSGSTGAVRVMDINRFSVERTLRPSTEWPETVSDFGLAVSGGAFDAPGATDDVAVGARDKVVLFRAVQDSWPNFDQNDPLVIGGGPDWPTGDLGGLVSGDLDSSTPGVDELVVAAPEKNAVVVLFGLAACLADTSLPCASQLRLPLPTGAQRFGAALLVADVDDDGDNELLVGAPGSGEVFIYGFTAGSDDSTTPPTPTLTETLKATLAVPGSKGFGDALAFGRFTGGAPLLAVGAPETEVDDLANVGKIFLFSQQQALIDETGATLANPEGKELIGRTLVSLPFATGGETHDVLAAAGKDALFVFFSNLTDEHDDLRSR